MRIISIHRRFLRYDATATASDAAVPVLLVLPPPLFWTLFPLVLTLVLGFYSYVSSKYSSTLNDLIPTHLWLFWLSQSLSQKVLRCLDLCIASMFGFDVASFVASVCDCNPVETSHTDQSIKATRLV